MAASTLPAASGIIPACAGSTRPAPSAPPPGRDHPRMRGEHSLGFGGDCGTPGSSPHARGAPARRAPPRTAPGIIPACAGSTGTHERLKRLGEDHPRMRGEHHRGRRDAEPQVGSSPHARGARLLELGDLRVVGIIPACAGSTEILRRTNTGARDHPRMRGEHKGTGQITETKAGSSPHARGALSSRPERSPSARIIPAYAGSTGSGSGGWRRRRDHPRMRGEHGGWRCRFPSAPGSSPHARGAPRQGGPDAEHRGIIPACAGSTRCRWPARRSCRDHPRMRGEHRRGGE